MARVFGLTGGFASGKSTVAAMLRDLGAVVVDADVVAREVVEPGTPAYGEIVAAFGPEVVGPDGRLDRARLADRVFADPHARARLNAITHPRVRARMADELARLQRTLPVEAVIVLDIPLLLDTAPRDAFPLEGILVVLAGETIQLARAEGRGMDRGEAERRLRAQRPLADKVAEAEWTIDNNGTLEQTRRQVEAWWRTVAAPAPGR